MLGEVSLFLHLLSTALMCGIVWFVQVIHYPLFSFVDDKGFSSYEQEHVRRTKYLIMPLMLIELATALIMMQYFSGIIYWANLMMLGLIWVSTFFVQVPLHGKLSASKNNENINKLVLSNWIRTIFWTTRTILLIAIIIF